MQRILFLSILLLLFSCQNSEENDIKHDVINKDSTDLIDTLSQFDMDTLDIESDYDLSTVDAKDKKEFVENLVKIEEKYGEQWDFCSCIVKRDSIQKAFEVELSDEQFEKVLERSDYFDEKCQAFSVQSSDRTPEERVKHERKVKNCLKEAAGK